MRGTHHGRPAVHAEFPFLFGGTFIEGPPTCLVGYTKPPFPFLFGGTFIEGGAHSPPPHGAGTFPFLFGGTFIEGGGIVAAIFGGTGISLPFRRDFH